MLAIAGQTAGPNGLNFFEGILEYPRGKKMLSNLNFFKIIYLKIPWATPAIQLVYIII